MTWWRDIPPRLYAAAIGVLVGSIALITIRGQTDGYGKSTLVAAGIAPMLCIVAGALMPDGTSLQMAALIGGLTAMGGTNLLVRLTHRWSAIAESALPTIVSPPGHVVEITGDIAPAKVLAVDTNRPELTPFASLGETLTPTDKDAEVERLLRELDKG